MAALRALPAQTTDGYEVKLRGYYTLGDNTPQNYRWFSTSGATDDGGSAIVPNSYSGQGRWLLVWDHVTANVRTWGAHFVTSVYGATAANDSLSAINNAIKALPLSPNDGTQSPGAAYSSHGYSGQLYFPGGTTNSGYVVSNEILVSAYIRILGDGSSYSLIGFLPNTATDSSNPKWVIRYLYNNSALQANENFYTGIWGINVNAVAASNPGGCGISFIGCNGTYMIDCVAEAALQPFKVDSNGVYLDRLTTGNGCRGPGLELMGPAGSDIVSGYLDIEHVNNPNSPGTDPNTGALYPAVFIHDLNGFSLGMIATEGSALSVHIKNS